MNEEKDLITVNGWTKWENHVLAELKRLNGWIEAVDQKLDKVSEEISGLKGKSGIWGLIGGFIPAVGVALYFLIRML